jgi:hypothetical protein
MNTFYNEQNPASTEQTYLNQLENYQQRLMAYLTSFGNNTLLSPEQIGSLLQTMAQWEPIFEGFAPQARSLSAQGYPKLSQRLTMILNDYHTAYGIYQQMYQNALRTRNQIYGIWQNTQADILQGWQQVNRHQQQVFERSNKDMHAAMFGCCPRCGTYVGTYALCLNCACDLEDMTKSSSWY